MVDIDDIAASVLMEIEEQPTVPLWISVEDKLPEDIYLSKSQIRTPLRTGTSSRNF